MKSGVLKSTDEAEKGKQLILIAKRLKAYSLADRMVAQFFSATSVSGRAGLLASALRFHQKMGKERFRALCAEEGFNSIDIRNTLIPWLKREGLAEIRDQNGEVSSVSSLVLVYEVILESVARLFEELGPTDEERGCVLVLELASQLPTPESVVLQRVSAAVGDKVATKALDLSKAYKIVESKAGKGLREPMLYSLRVWRNAISRASKSLSALRPDQRAAVEHLVERVRDYQGYPESELRYVATSQSIEAMLDLAIGVGLITQTWIASGDGNRRAFLTTPHFYADMAEAHGEDACDRVKLFLDSVRNGQHFGRRATGRITDPTALLRKLINAREIGPCTAIGRDYTMAERAGIVKVQRSALKAGQYLMELVQEDTVRQVYDIVTRGQVEQIPMSTAELGPDGRFVSAEEGRLAEAPGKLEEAERAVILALREG